MAEPDPGAPSPDAAASKILLPAKKKKGGAAGVPKPRERNPLFDVLVAIEGCDPQQVTKPLAGRVAKALATIRDVSPDVTVAEIKRRAAVYAAEWPRATLTAMALATHWGRMGGAKKEGGGPQVETAAPAGFERACEALYGDVTPWAMLGVGQQSEIREWLKEEAA
jgi:hypothetical protein